MGASARKEKSAAQGGRLKAARRYMPDVCGGGEPLGDTDRSGFAQLAREGLRLKIAFVTAR
jgi:hypothetical protein